MPPDFRKVPLFVFLGRLAACFVTQGFPKGLFLALRSAFHNRKVGVGSLFDYQGIAA